MFWRCRWVIFMTRFFTFFRFLFPVFSLCLLSLSSFLSFYSFPFCSLSLCSEAWIGARVELISLNVWVFVSIVFVYVDVGLWAVE